MSFFRYTDLFTCALLCKQAVVGVIAGGGLFRLVSVVGFERPGDPGDVGQIGGGAGEGGRPTLQEELPVIDDSGTCRKQQKRL